MATLKYTNPKWLKRPPRIERFIRSQCYSVCPVCQSPIHRGDRITKPQGATQFRHYDLLRCETVLKLKAEAQFRALASGGISNLYEPPK